MMRLLLLWSVFATVRAIPVDNGVQGVPEVECGSNSLIINFNTRNNFEGHVYVKGLYSEPGCRNDEVGRSVAKIELVFDSCEVRRARSLNPRGVFVSTTVVVSFHPLFVTKVDRAYHIQCFYMEADKTVDTGIEVSTIPTAFRTHQVPMPICRYEILENSQSGQRIEFATVGQQIYHKFTCDTETVGTFCMVVHSCYVDDTAGDRVELVDENGCALDRYLLNNPEYISDLMAGVEAHVFKFADRADLYFQCQVTVLVKEATEECPRPFCATPGGRGAGSANPQTGPAARRPAVPFPLEPGSAYLPRDVRLNRIKRSPTVSVAGTTDIQAELSAAPLESRVSFADNRVKLNREEGAVNSDKNICLSPVTITIALAVSLVFGVFGVSTIVWSLRRRSRC